MLLPLDTLLTATLEGGLNHLLRRDPQSAVRAQPLLGKVLRIEIRDLRTFWLLFSQDNVELFSRYEAQADAGITTTLGALPKLREKDQLTALIRAGEVDLQGDPALFNHFSQLLAELQIDWERELGHFTGRTLASKLLRAGKVTQRKLSEHMRLSREELAEYLTEEIRLAPGSLEVACFCEDVTELRKRLDQAAVRLEKLLARSQA